MSGDTPQWLQDWCAERGHPGHTFNRAMSRTWCACGDVQTDGDTKTTGHQLCCDRLPDREAGSVADGILASLIPAAELALFEVPA